jgi:Phage integrase family
VARQDHDPQDLVGYCKLLTQLHARERADELGHTEEEHYLWCASQHHHHDPTKPAKKWDGAWRSLRDAAGLPGFRFHDLRHTVVTDLLEAGEPEHVIQAVTGQLSKKMLEHYSHQRLKAKVRCLGGWGTADEGNGLGISTQRRREDLFGGPDGNRNGLGRLPRKVAHCRGNSTGRLVVGIVPQIVP